MKPLKLLDQDLERYKNRRVIGYTGEYVRISAQIVGMKLDVFQTGVDGRIRRFPESQIKSNRDGLRSGHYYDGTDDSRTRQMAGYVVDQEKMEAGFYVDDKAHTPIYSNDTWEVFKLPNGKHFVPQPSSQSCTQACKAMLLLDSGLKFDVVCKQAGNFTRQDFSGLAVSLREMSGYACFQIQGNYEHKAKFVESLKFAISKNGPCILNRNGHVSIVDDMREDEDGQMIFVLREPYHGVYIEMKDSPDIWFCSDHSPIDNPKNESLRKLEAIFLTRTLVI